MKGNHIKMATQYMQSPFIYKIKFKIGNIDLSNQILGISFINSINIMFQIFKINVILNKSDIVKEKIFGDKYANLTIFFKHRKYEYKLIILDHRFDSQNINSNSTSTDACNCEFKCALECDFKILSKDYVKVFHNKTLKEIIKTMSDDLGINLFLNPYELNGNKIDQVLLSHRNPVQHVLYLDKYFGLYDGPLLVFLYNKNLVIDNLNYLIKTPPVLMFNRFNYASGQNVLNPPKGIIKYCEKNENCFNFYNPLFYTNNGPKKVGIMGETIEIIAKPSTKLFYPIELKLSNICKECGVVDGFDKTFYNPELKNNKVYYIDETGYEETKFFARAFFSKKVANQFQIKFELNGYILLQHVNSIGQPFLLKSWDPNEIELNGKYILQSIEINLINSRNEWQERVVIYGMKTNFVAGRT